jgi:hypothetical protein
MIDRDIHEVIDNYVENIASKNIKLTVRRNEITDAITTQ